MTKPEKKETLLYSLNFTKESGYGMCYVSVFSGRLIETRDLFDGTVDNKAGYGSPEAAAQLGKWYKHLIDEGHKVIVEPSFSSRELRVEVKWQEFRSDEYGDSYCEPHLEFGNNRYDQVESGMQLLKRIGRKIERMEFNRTAKTSRYRSESDKPREMDKYTFSDPADFINALDALGAKRVRTIREPGTYQFNYVLDPGQRPLLLTDTLFRMMGI